MKIRSIIIYAGTLICLFLVNTVVTGQSIVKDVNITSEEAKVKFAEEKPGSYFIEIGGSDGYYWKQRVDYKNVLSLTNRNAEGEPFADGTYTMQITPIIDLTDEQRALLSELRALNDVGEMEQFRKEHGLPDVVDVYAIHFSIRNGQFVVPDQEEGKLNLPGYSSQWEQDHPVLYASVQTMEMDYAPQRATDNTNTVLDQVILDDLIVVGSSCIGQDCNNGENFGFDTVRLKENNLRIKFEDTSNSASFPTNDWQLTANDSGNGGQNKFSIDDVTGGKTPFTIVAGAPSHSLYVDAQGDVGMGTSTPVVEAHIVDGDSPTLRLEQNGSAGFQSQTWDLAGNETNFFVRDVTNGSRLPFKIRPGAPDNLLYLNGGTSDNIGILTSSPNSGAKLHINATSSMILPLGTTAQRPSPAEGMLRGNSDDNKLEYFDGTSWTQLGGGSSVWSLNGDDAYRTTGNVGIGIDPPEQKLDVNGNAQVRGQYLLTGKSAATNEAGVMIGWQRTGTGSSVLRFYNQWSSYGSWGTTFGLDNLGNGVLEHQASGNLGISTLSTQDIVFSVNSNTELFIEGTDGFVGVNTISPSHQFTVDGDAAKPGGGDWIATSDRRVKKDIKPFEDGLSQVLKINPVVFKYNGKGGTSEDNKEYVGVIAQEIQKVAPYTVSKFIHNDLEITREEGAFLPSTKVIKKEEFLAVDATAVRYMLVNAVKEQQQIINTQQAEINQLQSELASLQELKSQVAALTELVMKQKEVNTEDAKVGDK